ASHLPVEPHVALSLSNLLRSLRRQGDGPAIPQKISHSRGFPRGFPAGIRPGLRRPVNALGCRYEVLYKQARPRRRVEPRGSIPPHFRPHRKRISPKRAPPIPTPLPGGVFLVRGGHSHLRSCSLD